MTKKHSTAQSTYEANRVSRAGRFRIEFQDRDRPSLTEYTDEYREALRKCRDGLLGSSGDTASVFLGPRLVNMAYLDRVRIRGGMKYIVRFSEGGEKLKKQHG